ARRPLPRAEGQHWAEWLREWGWYSRSAMAANPTLMQHYLAGGVSDERVFAETGLVLDVLTDAGFTPEQAAQAWGAIGAAAIRSAAEDIRLHHQRGATWSARAKTVLADHPPDALPALRALVAAGYTPNRDEEFEARLTMVLIGIARRVGLDEDVDAAGRDR